MTFVERLRNSQPVLWRRFLAAGILFLCVVVAGLLIATYSYAQKGVRIERKLEDENVPQRKVQPDGLREGKKKQAIDSKTDVDAMPSSGEHEHIEPHCHHKDIGCNEREKLNFNPTGNIYDINGNLIKGE